MMREKYDKLVRDEIPRIIISKGRTPVTHYASPEEYKKRILDKLVEEVNEFYLSECTEELGDIVDVVYLIAESRGITKQRFDEMREQKKKERGGFENRIVLDEIK